jgi:hypothetical protein
MLLSSDGIGPIAPPLSCWSPIVRVESLASQVRRPTRFAHWPVRCGGLPGRLINVSKWLRRRCRRENGYEANRGENRRPGSARQRSSDQPGSLSTASSESVAPLQDQIPGQEPHQWLRITLSSRLSRTVAARLRLLEKTSHHDQSKALPLQDHSQARRGRDG